MKIQINKQLKRFLYFRMSEDPHYTPFQRNTSLSKSKNYQACGNQNNKIVKMEVKKNSQCREIQNLRNQVVILRSKSTLKSSKEAELVFMNEKLQNKVKLLDGQIEEMKLQREINKQLGNIIDAYSKNVEQQNYQELESSNSNRIIKLLVETTNTAFGKIKNLKQIYEYIMKQSHQKQIYQTSRTTSLNQQIKSLTDQSNKLKKQITHMNQISKTMKQKFQKQKEQLTNQIYFLTQQDQTKTKQNNILMQAFNQQRTKNINLSMEISSLNNCVSALQQQTQTLTAQLNKLTPISQTALPTLLTKSNYHSEAARKLQLQLLNTQNQLTFVTAQYQDVLGREKVLTGILNQFQHKLNACVNANSEREIKRLVEENSGLAIEMQSYRGMTGGELNRLYEMVSGLNIEMENLNKSREKWKTKVQEGETRLNQMTRILGETSNNYETRRSESLKTFRQDKANCQNQQDMEVKSMKSLSVIMEKSNGQLRLLSKEEFKRNEKCYYKVRNNVAVCY